MTSPVIGGPSTGHGPADRPRLGDLRSHLTCVLCAGYFIDATTIVECLHTFCRSCILRHLEASSYCPICDVMIHRTKGSSSLRADRILQTIVYKLVPGLFSQEMKMRREFYEMKPYADPELPHWAKGDVNSYVPHVFTPDEHLQLRLAPFDTERCDEDTVEGRGTVGGPETVPPVRYLRCQAGTPLSVLHKFISAKFQLPPSVQVQLIYGQRVLPDDISLMDLGYLYRPAQDAPVRLEYRLVRKRPAASITPAATEAAPLPAAVKSELDAATSSPASAPAASTSDTASVTSETAAVTSEPSVEPSEPPAKRRRTDGESRQPVVLLERLFDADDEEPTSPKEVEDIIASLDAEEETPRQESTASPSPGPGMPKEEDVAQTSSAPPDPSSESDVVDTSADRVEERPAETDGDDQCATGSGLNRVPCPDVCAGGGDEGLASGETRVQEEVGVGEGATTDTVVTHSDVCGEVNTTSRDKTGYIEGAGTPAPAEASLEQPSSATAAATHVNTTSGTGTAEPASEKPTEDAPKADSKQGEADSELVCDDDTLSECGLVVDEEASVATPEAMDTPEDTPTASVPQSSPEAVRQESSVTIVQPGDPVESASASTETPPNPPSESPSPGAEADPKGKSVTTERGSSCAAGTQTSLCSVSKRSETLVSSASSSATTGSSTGNKVQTASIGDSSVLSKSSGAKTGSPCTSSVSCGTQDIEELSRKSPTKVDCSVQTVPAETARRPHKKPAKCVSSDANIEVRKETSMQRCQLGTMHPQRDTHLNNGLKTVSANAVKSLKGSLSKVTHPELASRLVQSVENIGDSRQATSSDIHKAYAANILKIPNAPSSKKPPQGPESKKMSGVAAKTVADRDAKHSPDSSSMSYAKSSPDMKHFFKEVPRSSSGVAKYLEKNHKRALTGSPLDLSTRANKSAADSTSMVPKRPGSKLQTRKLKPAKAQGTQTIHSIVRNLSRSEHISLTPIPSGTSKNARPVQPPKQRQRQPVPHEIQSASFPFPPGMSPHDFYSSPLHVNTSMASRLNYDLAMRNLLTLSHMAMAQGGMVRPPHMFPMQTVFPPRPNSHEFPVIPDPSLLRQPSEARMGAASKKASPTAGTTAPQLRTPTGLTSASIQHMEDLTRTVGKRTDKERHSVTVTPIPPK